MTDHSKNDNTMEARYRRAQTLMQGYWTRNLVPNSTVYPNWIEGTDCFWYERDINVRKNTGRSNKSIEKWDKEYRLVNARAATNTVAFNHKILAAVLAEAVDEEVDENVLPITEVEIQLDSSDLVTSVRFSSFNKSWVFESDFGSLKEVTGEIVSKERLLSPDGKKVIFKRDYNLWLKDLLTGDEHPLTNDGEELYCYAEVGNGWGHDQGACFSGLQARWSDDSKRIFTLQRDSRQVLTLPIVEHVPKDGSVRPKVHYRPLPMQGDDHVPEYRLVAIEVKTGRVQAANYPQIPITRNSWGFFSSNLGWWSADNKTAYFIDVERGYQTVRLVEFDTTNGETQILFEEKSKTHINLMLNGDDFPTFVPLPMTNELIWFSERSGWGHLYLYDLTTGEFKNPITMGEWVVRDVLAVDHRRRELFIQTAGRDLERDPYYRDLVRVNIDSGELTGLATGDFDYAAVSALHFDLNTFQAIAIGGRDIYSSRSVSHNGEFIVTTNSRANSIPTSFLLDRNGNEVMKLEEGDLSALYARVSESWQWPEPVKLLSSDGQTDIYGLVYRPSDFSKDQAYPVISDVFNTPDMPFTPKGSFSNNLFYGKGYFEAAALAELGFVVVQIDGRGASFRDKAFQDESYGWIESASNLEDHIAGIKQLAEKYSYMDLTKVGITSLMGGTGATQGLLHFPDFYKVGVGGMFHDSRLMPISMWGEMFEGLAGPSPEHHYPEDFAENLQGKLFMVHGMLDDETPPAIVFRMVEALQKANKDFDLLLMPNLSHGGNSYVVRRAWDYLVKHLQGTVPPEGFRLTTARDI